MRAKDALVEACSARQLELFSETPADQGVTEPSWSSRTTHDARTPIGKSFSTEPAKPRTPADLTRSAADRAALTKPAIGGQRTLPRLAVSPGEAAKMLGVSRDYFDEHVKPELRIVRRGRRILIALTELERWLDRAATRPGSFR